MCGQAVCECGLRAVCCLRHEWQPGKEPVPHGSTCYGRARGAASPRLSTAPAGLLCAAGLSAAAGACAGAHARAVLCFCLDSWAGPNWCGWWGTVCGKCIPGACQARAGASVALHGVLRCAAGLAGPVQGLARGVCTSRQCRSVVWSDLCLFTWRYVAAVPASG